MSAKCVWSVLGLLKSPKSNQSQVVFVFILWKKNNKKNKNSIFLFLLSQLIVNKKRAKYILIDEYLTSLNTQVV